MSIVVCISLSIGSNYTNNVWKRRLVETDYAEYHNKTGEWKLRTLSEIADTAVILGKQTPIKVEENK